MTSEQLAKRREKDRIAQRKYRAAHPERCRALAKERREADPEYNAKRRAQYAANPHPHLQRNRAGRAANPAIGRRQILKRHGLTIAEFDAMRQMQQGCCAVCGEPFIGEPHVDHDHATGKVRGLLCSGCNVGLGHFRDDPKRLLLAAAYLDASTLTPGTRP